MRLVEIERYRMELLKTIQSLLKTIQSPWGDQQPSRYGIVEEEDAKTKFGCQALSH